MIAPSRRTGRLLAPRPALSVLMGAVLLTGCSAGADPDSLGAAPSPPTIGDASAVPGLSPQAGAVPSPTATPAVRTVDVRFAGGAVSGTDGREQVALGEQVLLRLTSDVDESYHVHGYDLQGELPAGRTVDVPLRATIPGVFEVELHDSGRVLLQLRVA